MEKTLVHHRESEKIVSRDFELSEGETLTYIFINTLPLSHHDETETKLNFRLQKGSSLKLWHLIFGGTKSLLNEQIEFHGEEAMTENYTVYFGDGLQDFQMFITHLHEAPSCTSRIFSRGILKDQAKARYDGMIKILQTAKKTDAFLEEKTLLLSPDAKSEAIPGLEIGTNDVRAAHSASCTRVDEAQLFYAASRGIPEEEALRIIAEGFLRKLLDRLPDQKIQKTAFQMIHDRLSLTGEN